MAYNWAQLAFVEKWRLHAVRGHLVGMHRPADKTYFDLRLKSGEGNVGPVSGTFDLRLQDAGDIIVDKRFTLLARVSVVVRAVGRLGSEEAEAAGGPHGRRLLEAGSVVSGALRSVDDDVVVVDIGFPLIVQLPEPAADLTAGATVRIAVSEPPKGFLVV